jgi:hypothetical protein
MSDRAARPGARDGPDGAAVLRGAVPIVIHLMMEHAYSVWGEACYPVVE